MIARLRLAALGLASLGPAAPGLLPPTPAGLGSAHPMHTSVTDLAHDPARRALAISVRAFADDFAAAVPGGGDSAAARYLRARLVLLDRTGRMVPLRWEGAAREGDVVHLRLAADLPAGPAGMRVRNGVLCERFGDQVNLVCASYGGRTVTLLFTPGDGAKLLP